MQESALPRVLLQGCLVGDVLIQTMALTTANPDLFGFRVAPPGFEPALPDPERRPQGTENGQFDRKWRPNEHRRPVGLTSMSAQVRRKACKTLAALS